ncbi:MAG: hypothetical protein JXQ75_16295, partial [Phycisphaerae bacterium]|nr:hypothetical protein [Phycisphaerae bacterium]
TVGCTCGTAAKGGGFTGFGARATVAGKREPLLPVRAVSPVCARGIHTGRQAASGTRPNCHGPPPLAANRGTGDGATRWVPTMQTGNTDGREAHGGGQVEHGEPPRRLKQAVDT